MSGPGRRVAPRGRGRRTALALALAGCTAVLGATGVPATRPALELRAASWVLPGRPLAIELEQQGILEGRRLAIYLFVDDNQFDRLTTQGDRTRARIPLPELAPGSHRLAVRSGTEAAEVSFRLLAWSEVAAWAAGPLAGVLLLFFGGSALLRARRRRAGLSASGG